MLLAVQVDSCSDPYDASMENVAGQSQISSASSLLQQRGIGNGRTIRVSVVHSSNRRKPSGRAWARELGISHTWLQKLVRKFMADPSEMWRLQIARGGPAFAQLSRAREHTREMRESGELRVSRWAKC